MIEILQISFIAFMVSATIREEHSPLSWYCDLIEKLPWYLCKPMGGCYRCFTGQVCLWYFIFTKPFNIINCLFFLFAGIFASMFYNVVYCYLHDYDL